MMVVWRLSGEGMLTRNGTILNDGKDSVSCYARWL